MTSSETDDLPSEFLALWCHAKRLIRPRENAETRLHILPPSLTYVAERVEQSPLYQELLKAYPWGERLNGWKIAHALRRAGFYQAIQDDSEPIQLWRKIKERLNPHTVPVRRLALLDGCWFSEDRFSVGGVSVERFSTNELVGIGPRLDVAQVFFPSEILDPDWYSQVWFLAREEQREIKPNAGTTFHLSDVVLKDFWMAIHRACSVQDRLFRLALCDRL